MAQPIQLTSKQLELASKLTALQRKYVIALVGSSMSQREAYLAAGGKAKSESAQDNSASIMLSKSKVRAFYDSLSAQSATSAVLSRTEALEILTRNAKESDERRDQHAAIKQLSDMEGWNAPKRSELTGKGGAPVAIDSNISAPEIAAALNGLMSKL